MMVRQRTREEWRPVVGWEGFYEFSSFGRVRSLDRIDNRGRLWRGQIKRPRLHGRYLVVDLSRDGVKHTFSVHVLICRAFHGEPPADKPWALHWDGNSLNNHPDNLYWGSPQDNADDAKRHGTVVRGERKSQIVLTCVPRGDHHYSRTKPHLVARGEHHSYAKLTDDQVAFYKTFAGLFTNAVWGSLLGVHRRTISDIRQGKTWSHITL